MLRAHSGSRSANSWWEATAQWYTANCDCAFSFLHCCRTVFPAYLSDSLGLPQLGFFIAVISLEQFKATSYITRLSTEKSSLLGFAITLEKSFFSDNINSNKLIILLRVTALAELKPSHCCFEAGLIAFLSGLHKQCWGTVISLQWLRWSSQTLIDVVCVSFTCKFKVITAWCKGCLFWNPARWATDIRCGKSTIHCLSL